MLRRDEALRKALSFKVVGRRMRGRPQEDMDVTSKKEIGGIVLQKEDAFNRVIWRIAVKLVMSEKS